MKVDSEEELDLWREWASDPIDETRNRLIEFYIPRLEGLARKLWFTFPTPVKTQVSVEDLLTASMIAMPAAIENFNPSRNIKAMTYLGARARGAMLDYLRDIDWVPRLARSRGEVKQKFSLETHPQQTQANNGSAYGIGIKVEHSGLMTTDPNPERLEQREFCEFLLRRLTAQERNVLRLYYLEGLSMKQTGVEIGVSESRVSQIVKGALSYLRRTHVDDQ